LYAKSDWNNLHLQNKSESQLYPAVAAMALEFKFCGQRQSRANGEFFNSRLTSCVPIPIFPLNAFADFSDAEQNMTSKSLQEFSVVDKDALGTGSAPSSWMACWILSLCNHCRCRVVVILKS
jgi:hypothetical protein